MPLVQVQQGEPFKHCSGSAFLLPEARLTLSCEVGGKACETPPVDKLSKKKVVLFKFIPRRNPINVVVDTKTMLQSLERVSVVISEKLKSPVRCQFGEDKVTMSAKTANGDAKDVCRIAGDGQGLEIGFNNRYLMDALRYAPADTVRLELTTGVSPCVILPTEGEENFLYMVLPVRLKAN